MQNIIDWYKNSKHRVTLHLYLAGILISLGLFGIVFLIFLTNSGVQMESDNEVEFISTDQVTVENNAAETIVIVDIGGGVISPGVYGLPTNSRLSDLIDMAGGFAISEIDGWWLQKNLNLAEVLIDGQKYYVPFKEENNDSRTSGGVTEETSILGGLVAINKAPLNELTTLEGIGEVRAQKIIDSRPYTSIDELVTKDVLTTNMYEKIKNMLSLN